MVLELCSGSGMFTKYVKKEYNSYTCLDLSNTLLDKLNDFIPHISGWLLRQVRRLKLRVPGSWCLQVKKSGVISNIWVVNRGEKYHEDKY